MRPSSASFAVSQRTIAEMPHVLPERSVRTGPEIAAQGVNQDLGVKIQHPLATQPRSRGCRHVARAGLELIPTSAPIAQPTARLDVTQRITWNVDQDLVTPIP